MSAPLHITRSMILEGEGGMWNYGSSQLVFDKGVSGIICDHVNTSAPPTQYGRGDHAILRDLAILSVNVSATIARWTPATAYAVDDIIIPSYYVEFGRAARCIKAGTSGSSFAYEPAWPTAGFPTTTVFAEPGGPEWELITAHGVTLPTHGVVCENLLISGFPGDGYHVVASYANIPPTNANCTQISRGRVQSCGGCGLFIIGDDTNASVMTGVDFSSNRGWGVRDQSFLGNAHVGHHVDGNESGAYWSWSSKFFGCYAEGGQLPSVIAMRASMYGLAPGGSALTGSYVAPWKANTAYVAYVAATRDVPEVPGDRVRRSVLPPPAKDDGDIFVCIASGTLA